MAKKILLWLANLLKIKPKEQEFENKGIYITAEDARELIKEQLGKRIKKTTNIYLADTKYYLPSVEYAKHVISEDTTDQMQYRTLEMDCDDFAWLLKAAFVRDAYRNKVRRPPHCMGVIHGLFPTPHAINWVINDDRVLRFIEPQTDALFAPRDTDKDVWLVLS